MQSQFTLCQSTDFFERCGCAFSLRFLAVRRDAINHFSRLVLIYCLNTPAEPPAPLIAASAQAQKPV